MNTRADVPKRRGLSPHSHSGKVLARHHTSYPALAFLVLLSGVLAAAVSMSGQAASSLISVTVQGPPPSAPATIGQPTNQSRFATNNQTVRGTCPIGLGIEIYRNGAFAGSTLCDVNGLYAVLITLVPGQNDLVARDVDALNQYGPDSNAITVFYDAPPPVQTPAPGPALAPTTAAVPTPSSTAAPLQKSTKTPLPVPKTPDEPALLIGSSRHFRQGADVDAPIEWSINVNGGLAPYRVTWNWGDGATDTTRAPTAGTISLSHTYAKPGTYQAVARAKDARQREAVMQLVFVVNGPASMTAAGDAKHDAGNLVLVWPILGLTTVILASFWLGERHKLALSRTGAN